MQRRGFQSVHDWSWVGVLISVQLGLFGCGASHSVEGVDQQQDSNIARVDAGFGASMDSLLDQVRRTTEALRERDCACGNCDVSLRVDASFWTCMTGHSAAAPDTFEGYYTALLAYREDLLECYGQSSCDEIDGGECGSGSTEVVTNPPPAVVSVAGASCERASPAPDPT